MASYRPSNEGFTLLEVLVALIVMGLALGMLSGAISDSVIRAERVATDDRALALAGSLLASLGRDVQLRPGVTSGQKENLLWHLSVIPSPGRPTALPLDSVTLTIKTRTGLLVGQWRTLRIAPRPST